METKIIPKTEKSKTELIEHEDHSVVLALRFCAQ
jgi:hypothetical protein